LLWLAADRRPIGVSVRSFILEKKRESDGGLADAAPHYHGHRERLRGRFREAGADALSDYELLELLLFRGCRAATSSRSPRRCWRNSAHLPK
jgi:hypothetical protein